MTADAALSSTTQIRVIVVDDQPMVRMGLRMMINNEPDLSVVGEAADGAEAVTLAAALRPDVILMDVRMPGTDGISATRTIVGAGTAGAVVIVTTFDDEQYLLDGVRAGAYGFMLKDAGPDLIVAAVRSAHAGDTLIAPSMTRALLEERLRSDQGLTSELAANRSSTVTAVLETLTFREREVLSGLARGAGNADIARDLCVSEATVKTHLSSILAKTGTASRLQAAVFAYESGFVRPGWLTNLGGTDSRRNDL